MNKHLNDKIDGIDRAISTLPDVEQAEVLPQLAQRVFDRTGSLMTPEQHAVVSERMSEPREYATAAEVDGVLAKSRTGR